MRKILVTIWRAIRVTSKGVKITVMDILKFRYIDLRTLRTQGLVWVYIRNILQYSSTSVYHGKGVLTNIFQNVFNYATGWEQTYVQEKDTKMLRF